MSDTSTHLGLPYLLAAQAQKHVTHNEALRLLDAMVQLSVLDRTRTTPPASPVDGDQTVACRVMKPAAPGFNSTLPATTRPSDDTSEARLT